jgi:HK97 family phage major capsid protein
VNCASTGCHTCSTAPVLETEDMDGAINASQNNYIAIIGDFAQGYVIADRAWAPPSR